MTKRVLKVKDAIIQPWTATTPTYVMHATMAEHDPARGFYAGTPIRTSKLVSVNGVPVDTIPGEKAGELSTGDVVETLNTIYEVV